MPNNNKSGANKLSKRTVNVRKQNSKIIHMHYERKVGEYKMEDGERGMHTKVGKDDTP